MVSSREKHYAFMARVPEWGFWWMLLELNDERGVDMVGYGFNVGEAGCLRELREAAEEAGIDFKRVVVRQTTDESHPEF